MPTYEVTARITVSADSEEQALRNVGAAIEYYDLKTGEFKIQGCGGPNGYVLVKQVPR